MTTLSESNVLESLLSGSEITLTVLPETTVKEIYQYVVDTYPDAGDEGDNKVKLVDSELNSGSPLISLSAFRPRAGLDVALNGSDINGGCRTRIGKSLVSLFPSRARTSGSTRGESRRLAPQVKGYFATDSQITFRLESKMEGIEPLNVDVDIDDNGLASYTMTNELFNGFGRFNKATLNGCDTFLALVEKTVEVDADFQSLDVTYAYKDMMIENAESIESAVVQIQSKLTKAVKAVSKISSSMAQTIQDELDGIDQSSLTVTGNTTDYQSKKADWIEAFRANYLNNVEDNQ